MILLVEPNIHVRKRLCDLIRRERIIGIDTYPQTLEMVAKFRNNINIIIANIRLLKDILLRGTLFKMCQKLYIEMPPILVLYRKGDEKIKDEFEKDKLQFKLIKYDSEDNSFPERYIQAVRELYPEVIADAKKAMEVWLKGDQSQSFEEVRNWLVKEGFLEAIEHSQIGKLAQDITQIIPMVKKILAEEKELSKKEAQIERDYKKMYFELRQKYDKLIEYMNKIVDISKID